MTLGNIQIPLQVEQALIARAAAERKSVESVTLDVLAHGLGVTPQTPDAQGKYRDLSDIAGHGGMDSDTLAALEEQRRIDVKN